MAREQVFIGIGSNIGDREKNIKLALDLLSKDRTTRIEKVSSLRETDPVGGPPQPRYLNGVVKITTGLRPAALLRFLKSIERTLGRKPAVRNGPRTIDMDILLYGDISLDTPELTIPHPRMREREFVLVPLEEIAPGIREKIVLDMNAGTSREQERGVPA